MSNTMTTLPYMSADERLRADRTQRWARLVVNPSSGSQGALPQLPAIVTALEEADMHVVLSFTSAESSPKALAAQAVREQYDLVVVAGGDGTISAVAQGLLGTTIPLGIIPVGTYNNIARSLAIPSDLDGALAVLLHGRAWRIDSATANGTPFMEVAGVGLDARLFPVAEQIKSGAWSQVGVALRTLRYYRPRKLRIELPNGQRLVTRPLMALVSNMPYFGMGFAVAPAARPDSGQLVLSLFENMTKLQLLRHFAAIANGRQVQEPRISTYQGKRFRIVTTARPAMLAQADGNVVGRTPVVIEVVPQALTVIAPPPREP
jgi:diacylglycerol kinase (ATP)